MKKKMPMSLPHCVTCGHCMLPEDELRHKDAGDLVAFTRRYCAPTHFVYLYLQSLDKRYRPPLCCACLNWQRRVGTSGQGARGSKKPLIPMDSLLVFVDQPTVQNAPDKRTLVRLLRSLAFPRKTGHGDVPNCYTMFAGPALRCVLHRLRERGALEEPTSKDVIKGEIVRGYWLTHGMPTAFESGELARVVRRMARDHDGGDDDDDLQG